MTHLITQTSRALARGATALAVLAGGAAAQQGDSARDSTTHQHAVTLPTVHTVSAGQKTADAANAVIDHAVGDPHGAGERRVGHRAADGGRRGALAGAGAGLRVGRGDPRIHLGPFDGCGDRDRRRAAE